MTAILSEWTDTLRILLHHKWNQQYQRKNKTFFSSGVKATVILIPFTNNYYAFAFYLLSLPVTGYICFPWEN